MTTPKTEIYFATRKTASAHVYITKGKGKVRINNVPLEMIPQETAREVMLVPLEITGDLRDKIDISVRVSGGGFMGQASAVATGISRALTGWTKSKKAGAGTSEKTVATERNAMACAFPMKPVPINANFNLVTESRNQDCWHYCLPIVVPFGTRIPTDR